MGWLDDIRPRVIVVDFGGVYGHLTARRIFELGYRVRVVAATDRLYSGLKKASEHCDQQINVVLAACKLNQDPRIDERIFSLGLRILGICNGHQLIARAFGADIIDLVDPEIGLYRFQRSPDDRPSMLHELPIQFTVSMYHRQSVARVPATLRSLGWTEKSPVAAFVTDDNSFFGCQFHPEATETEHGSAILSEFLAMSLGLPSELHRKGSSRLMSVMDSLHRTQVRQRERSRIPKWL